MGVLPRDPETSDHCAIVVDLALKRQSDDMDEGEVPRPRQFPQRAMKRKRSTLDDLPSQTSLDRLVIEAVQFRADLEEQLDRIYGQGHGCTNKPRGQVYVDGSCLGNGKALSRAGAGVFFGPGDKRNLACRVPDRQTNNRGEVYAILLALQHTDPHAPLTIYSDSEYALCMLTEWAPKHHFTGWTTENGDLLSDIVFLLQRRCAPVRLVKVKGHSGNKHNDGADELAKRGAGQPQTHGYRRLDRGKASHMPCHPCTLDLHASGDASPKPCKVTYDLGLRRPESDPQKGARREESLCDQNANLSIPKQRSRHRARQAELRRRITGAKTEREFWAVIKLLSSAHPELGFFTAEELKTVFQTRMNPLVPLPSTFDSQRHSLNHAAAATIPTTTEDHTTGQYFETDFTIAEIELAKGKLRKRVDSACGGDGITYGDVFNMENEALQRLCNACLREGQAPSTWLKAELIGICKKGKPKDDPASYRTIGLESCLLKFMTLLINERLVRWATDCNLIPRTQNGFRENHRTNNNAFILQSALDKAKAQGKTLFVAFVDMTNAFPSTDHETLWLKLRKLGAGGKVFDWLRMLYRDISYTVSHGGEVSADFKSAVGILIGDTCSPILWNLFMSDLEIASDPEDITIGGAPLTNLEQADDLILIATSAAGLQRKIDALYRWCATNFLILNAAKSFVMVFGSKPRGMQPFTFGKDEIKLTDDQTYVGIRFQSRAGSTYRKHYDDKAAKAQRVGRIICGLESMVGTLHPRDAVNLYMALVDPHLTHGCEVIIDTNPAALLQLEKIQAALLRRIIGLGSHSILVVLFTETGIVPIKYRRIVLALGYLAYLLSLPQDNLAAAALRECLELEHSESANWLSRLREVITNLPFYVRLPQDVTSQTPDDIRNVATRIIKGLHDKQLLETETCDKLYLLRGREEITDPNRPPRPVASLSRKYLDTANPRHRRAMSRILASNHPFALEKLRYSKSGGTIPREERRCRFCRSAVESPEHVLLECTADEDMLRLRRSFVSDLAAECTPITVHRLMNCANTTEQLKTLCRTPQTIRRTAQLMDEMLALVEQFPLYNSRQYTTI